MKRRARVISIAGSANALVELDGVSQCQRCSRGQGCGAGFLSSASAASAIRIQCETRFALEPGQQVQLELEETGSQWLWLVFGAYGLPLAGMLLGTILASVASGYFASSTEQSGPVPAGELAGVIAALCGLIGGFIAWRVVMPRALDCAQRSLCLQSARIVAIIPPSHREP